MTVRKTFPKHAHPKKVWKLKNSRKHHSNPGKQTRDYNDKVNGIQTIKIEKVKSKEQPYQVHESWVTPIVKPVVEVKPLVVFKQVEGTIEFTKFNLPDSFKALDLKDLKE